MKTTAKQFKEFKEEFKKWQGVFGLGGYQAYFKLCELEDSFATLSYTPGQMVVTVSLNNEVTGDDALFFDPKKSAKHEAVHLLLARLSVLASERCISDNAIYEAEEEIVNKLVVIL